MNTYELKRSLLSGALLLSLMLTGCGKKDDIKNIFVKDTYNRTMITYSEEGISGTVPLDEVSNYIKIVTFKLDDYTFTRLVAIEDHTNHSVHSPHYRITKYHDLDTGTTLISYTNQDSSGETDFGIEYSVGENLEILSEIDFVPYLIKEGKISNDYDINDMLDFYHEKVEPSLEDSEIVLN